MPPTREQIEEIIDKLAEPNEPITTCDNCGSILQLECVCQKIDLNKPVLIGGVLDTAEMIICWEEEDRNEKRIELCNLWHEFGFTKSLQQIVKEGGWLTFSDGVQVLKSKPASDLFRFLISIFK